MQAPFLIRREEQVVFFELDTPGSSVNIITRTAARQIAETLDSLCQDNTQLVVFTSGKPYSYINGAQLVFTPSIQYFSDIVCLIEPIRSAYERIADFPIVTVAAIEGCCYGCGVEFTLGCDYRVASDAGETKFYMTELKDYYLPPVFGALQKLPHLMGYQAAIEFLLLGETWSAEKAFSKGLIDQVLAAEHFPTELAHFIDQLLRDGTPKKSLKKQEVDEETLDRQRDQMLQTIAELPEERQLLHKGCLELMHDVLSHDQAKTNIEKRIGSLFNSLPVSSWRNASIFFFLRTMARTVSLGTSDLIPEKAVEIFLAKEIKNPLLRIFRQKKLRGLSISQLPEVRPEERENIAFYLHDKQTETMYPVKMAWGYTENAEFSDGNWLYFPDKEQGGFCEAFLSEQLISVFRPFLILLFHLGWEPLINHIPGESIINRFGTTYLDGVERYLAKGRNDLDLNHTMWCFGFETLPTDFSRKFRARNITGYAEDYLSGENDPSLLDYLFQPLYAEGIRLIEEGKLKHSSQIDLIMKLVFGFPVSKGSFCTYVKQKIKSQEEVF